VAEAFSFLQSLKDCRADIEADFVGRIAGVKTSTDKEEVLRLLKPHHENVAARLGFQTTFLAEQVHGDCLAVIDKTSPPLTTAVDGLITHTPDICLGIHVADCGAIYIVDRESGALALLHSGKKGTELNIIGKAIQRMAAEFGSRPSDLTVALGPCIRPPHYEIDFATTIRQQALAAGVTEQHYHDCNICTSDLARFYSYRLEKGNTGRMIALLGRHSAS